MSEQVKKLVPKLRFPEFRDVSVWEDKKLEDICIKISQGGTPDTTIPEYWNGEIEWLTPAEMGKLETRFINETNRKITKAGLKNCSSELLPIDSVILSTRAPIGHLLINKVEMAINQGCKALVPLASTDCNFLYYALVNSRKKLSDLGAGNTFKELSGSALKSFSIKIPHQTEQQKIADCLSSLDDLITAQNQKVEALKLNKKGLMQQLFPADGETVPKLRFSEFENDGEWQFIPLSKIAKRSTQKNRNEQITRVLTNSAEFGVVEQRDFFDKDIATQGNLEGYYIVEEGDYVYNPRISSFAPVGPISKNKIGLGVMSPLYTVFRFENEQNDFYSLFFKSTGWHHYMRQASSTGARHDRMAISNEAFMDMPIPVTSNREQQKIADFLSSIDELITTETQQLEAYKTHKKGLMQQLFPSLDEV